MKFLNSYRNRGINYDLRSDFRFSTERLKGKTKRHLRKKMIKKWIKIISK